MVIGCRAHDSRLPTIPTVARCTGRAQHQGRPTAADPAPPAPWVRCSISPLDESSSVAQRFAGPCPRLPVGNR